MVKIMAIDYGDTRTGLAVSDASGTLAGSAWVIEEKSKKALAKKIAHEAVFHSVCAIVVGYPKNMDGSAGTRAALSAELAQLLRELCGDIEIVLWDERLTTMSAHRILSDTKRYGKKRKKTVDAVAASLILESYLRFLKNNKNNQ